MLNKSYGVIESMLNIKILGMDKLLGKLKGDTVKKPLDDGIKKITYSLEAEVKKATVVDTGVLRSGTFSQFGTGTAMVGTNVKYAPFVEYGTAHMEARHMEGGSKVLGTGMFAYGLEQLMKKMGDLLHKLGLNIEQKWGE